jgi:SAM-dependent methyltransferase/DNA-binding MarR family transcriptional regulator
MFLIGNKLYFLSNIFYKGGGRKIKFENDILNKYHGRYWRENLSWQELILLSTVVKIGLFELLAQRDQGLEIKEICQDLSIKPRATVRVLDVLKDMQLVDSDNHIYTLTELGKKLFSKNSPDYLGFSLLHTRRLIERWLTLPEVIKSDKPVPGDRFTESVEGFIRAMDVYARISAKEVVDICLAEAPSATSVLDIGGATGTCSKLFARRGLKTTLFDIPETIKIIAPEMSAYANITLAGGDFNQSLPDGPFDLAYLGNITHIYGPEKNQALFRRVAGKLTDNGKICILDWVRNLSPSASLFAINMLVNTESGNCWTKEEFTNWLKTAGFSAPKFINISQRDQQLIIAAKISAHTSENRP